MFRDQIDDTGRVLLLDWTFLVRGRTIYHCAHEALRLQFASDRQNILNIVFWDTLLQVVQRLAGVGALAARQPLSFVYHSRFLVSLLNDTSNFYITIIVLISVFNKLFACIFAVFVPHQRQVNVTIFAIERYNFWSLWWSRCQDIFSGYGRQIEYLTRIDRLSIETC